MAVSTLPPVLLAEIVVDGSTTLKAALGYGSGSGVESVYPDSIEKITPVSVEMDPIRRTIGVSTMTVTFKADGLARGWHVAYRLKGKTIKILSGARSLAYADYLRQFWGSIDNVKARPDGAIEIKCSDTFGKLRDADVIVVEAAKHPLEIAKAVFVAAGLTSDEYNYDDPGGDTPSLSFDPQNTQHAGYSHLVASTMSRNGYINPTKAISILEEVCWITGGCMRGAEVGRIDFVAYDPTATPSYTFTDDMIKDFEIVSQGEHIVNCAGISTTGYDVPTSKEYQHTYWHNETDSQAALAEYGRDPRVFSLELSSRMTVCLGHCMTTFLSTDGAGTEVTIDSDGYAGTRWEGFPSGSQETWAKLSTSRTGFFKIEDEVIEFDRLTIDTNRVRRNVILDGSGGWSEFATPYLFTARIKNRGVLGTSAQDHASWNGKTKIVDITTQNLVANRLTARHRYGLGVVKFKTPLYCVAPQIGDIVYLTTSRYADYGISSSTTALKWEVIGKEAVYFGADVGITYTLAIMSQTLPAETHDVTVFTPNRGFYGALAAIDETLMAIKVDDISVTYSGLVLTTTAGTITFGGATARIPPTEITVVISKDTYVYYDAVLTDNNASPWRTIAQTNGAGAPSTPSGCVLICKAVANGSAVTSVTNYTAPDPFVVASITTPTIAANAITGVKILDGEVTVGKIGSEAITTPKLGSGAVTWYTRTPEFSLFTLVPNGLYEDTTKG